MSEQQWLTYERAHHANNSRIYITQEASKKKPMGFGDSREATPEEIEAVIAKRRENEESRARLEAFQARPDYQDAAMIRNALEWMTPDENPLSALTPEEWADFRRRISR
jgi:hypothetical protein